MTRKRKDSQIEPSHEWELNVPETCLSGTANTGRPLSTMLREKEMELDGLTLVPSLCLHWCPKTEANAGHTELPVPLVRNISCKISAQYCCPAFQLSFINWRQLWTSEDSFY